MAKWFAATHNLHAKRTRDDVFRTLQEIVANLVGSEDFVIYERPSGESSLHLVVAYGVAQLPPKTVALGAGVVGRAAASGQTYLSPLPAGVEQKEDEENIRACIPLVGGREVAGVIVIYSLLPQKERLEEVDVRFLDLVGMNAAAVLERLDAEARAGYAGEEKK